MWYRSVDGGVEVSVKVIAGAKKNEIVGIIDRSASFGVSFLKVKINAQREKGKANQELISLLAKKINVAKSAIKVVKGQTQPLKVIFVPMGIEKIMSALRAASCV